MTCINDPLPLPRELWSWPWSQRLRVEALDLDFGLDYTLFLCTLDQFVLFIVLPHTHIKVNAVLRQVPSAL